MTNMIEQSEKEAVNRRDFIVLTASAVGAVGLGAFVWPVVDSLSPSADVLALASTEVDLSPIKEGQTIKIMWRGKPVFIKHMTEKEISESKEVKLDELRDPQSYEDRVQSGHEKWLVMIGVCTHLGCIPIAGKGDYDGLFCPCHGSHYDAAGRIRKGPAPKNLVIPQYKFISDNKIIIG
jgi:ubiquinol-cytochrome c reductase iron-sulfur subunit